MLRCQGGTTQVVHSQTSLPLCMTLRPAGSGAGFALEPGRLVAAQQCTRGDLRVFRDVRGSGVDKGPRSFSTRTTFRTCLAIASTSAAAGGDAKATPTLLLLFAFAIAAVATPRDWKALGPHSAVDATCSGDKVWCSSAVRGFSRVQEGTAVLLL